MLMNDDNVCLQSPLLMFCRMKSLKRCAVYACTIGTQYTDAHYTRAYIQHLAGLGGPGWVCGMVTFDWRFICSSGIEVISSIAIPKTVSWFYFQVSHTLFGSNSITEWRRLCWHHLWQEIFLDPEGGSQNTTVVVLFSSFLFLESVL